MEKKTASVMILTLLLTSMLTLAFNIQPVRASGIGYTRADVSDDSAIVPMQFDNKTRISINRINDITDILSMPPETEWNKTYGGIWSESACSVAQTSDNGYVFAGFTNSFGAGESDFWLVKVDSSGNLQWSKTYGGTDNEAAFSMVETVDGGYALAGYTRSFGAGWDDFWLVKVDSSGNLQWSKTYGGTDNEQAYSVAYTDDGGYAIAGITYSFGAGSGDFWLVKTDASGNVQWNQTYGGTGPDVANSVIQTDDGGYALAGFTYSLGPCVFWLVKTDSAGNVQWNQTYGTGGGYMQSVIQTIDGGYATTGWWQLDGVHEDFWLVKVDSSGNLQWSKTYDRASSDHAYCVVQTLDGGFMIVGTATESILEGGPAWLVRTDASGNMQWNKTYSIEGWAEAHSAIQADDGGYLIGGMTGDILGNYYPDSWLMKIAPSRDVAVTNITRSKTVVGQGYCMNITVTVENQGDFLEWFGVVAPYFDGVVIPTSVQWKAFWSMGDCSRDGYIDQTDLDIMEDNWGRVGPPGENPADLNSDGVVGLGDAGILGTNWGKDIWTHFGLPVPPKGTQRGVRLHSGNQSTLTFTWNTTEVAKGNYTITAFAEPVSGETDTADNTYTDGWVKVTVAGDINGDGIVNAGDLGLLGAAWFSNPNSPNWNPNADITGDGIVNAGDLGIIGVNWFKT